MEMLLNQSRRVSWIDFASRYKLHRESCSALTGRLRDACR
jgi:hypothetical protein